MTRIEEDIKAIKTFIPYPAIQFYLNNHRNACIKPPKGSLICNIPKLETTNVHQKWNGCVCVRVK
jgi:hypothetical protein